MSAASLVFALPLAVFAVMIWRGVKVWEWAMPDAEPRPGRMLAVIGYMLGMSAATVAAGIVAEYLYQVAARG